LTPAVTVGPADQQYPDMVSALNTRFVAAPGSVYVVNAPSQIAPIVTSAVSSHKRLTVRGGGHCFEDFVYNSDVQTIIDLTNMNRVYYEPKLNAIAIESGAILLDVYKKLYETWGMVVPGGMCYSVCVGGHVPGGGWGWLVRRNGLIVDHLYAVEVVVVGASGTVSTILATRDASDPNRELWWAHTGGGGGNFGVVTRYYFRSPNATGTDPRYLLPRPPAKVLFDLCAWNLNSLSVTDLTRLVQNYGNWHAANIAADNPNRFVVSTLQACHKSNGQVNLTAHVDAGAPNAQQLLNDYVAYMKSGVAAPLFEVQTQYPWLQFARMTGTTNPLANDPTLRGKQKSAFMKAAFTSTQAAAIYKHLTRTDINNPNIFLLFTPYGGATSAVGQTDTAIPHRTAAYKTMWSTQWASPADDAANLAWSRQCYQEIFADTGGVPVPNDASDGCYVNYADGDISDPNFNQSSSSWHDLYYKDNYPRLQQVKKKYDPSNFFQHRQSVELP